MHFGKLTVSRLIEELEDGDPGPRCGSRPSPPGRSNGALSREPGPAMQVDLEGQPVVYLVEAEQLGYLPGSVAEELGWSR